MDPDLQQLLLNVVQQNQQMQQAQNHILEVIAGMQAAHQQAGVAQHLAVARIPPPKLPDFDGMPDTDVQAFILSTTLALDANEVPEEARVRFVLPHLTGNALNWLVERRLLNPDAPVAANWPALSVLLREAFQPRHHQVHLRRKLRDLKQGSSLPEYVRAFRVLMGQVLEMAQLDRVDAFINGLHPAAQRQVRMGVPQTLNDAISLAETYAVAFGPAAGYQPTGGHLDTGAGPAMEVDAVVSSRGAHGARTRLLAKLTDKERDELRASGACFKCRRPGHIARDCPK